MQDLRFLNSQEKSLINYLCDKGGFPIPNSSLKGFNVKQENFGELRIQTGNEVGSDRCMGKIISEVMWNDLDGRRAMAALYLDQHGALFSLDVWKIDYSPVLSLSGWENNHAVALAS